MIPLPEPEVIDRHLPTGVVIRGYKAATVRTLIAAARRQALEDAARVCEPAKLIDTPTVYESAAIRKCAAAIRSLIDKGATPSVSDHAPGEAQPAPIPGRLP